MQIFVSQTAYPVCFGGKKTKTGPLNANQKKKLEGLREKLQQRTQTTSFQKLSEKISSLLEHSEDDDNPQKLYAQVMRQVKILTSLKLKPKNESGD